MRQSTRLFAIYGSLAAALYVLIGPLGLFSLPFLPDGMGSIGHGNTANFGLRSTDVNTGVVQQLGMTKFLAHQPGFSVIENLYWYNKTYMFLTDQPWAIPPAEHIAALSTDSRKPANGRVATQIWAIRNTPLSPEVQEERQVGHSISLQDAEEMFGNAIKLDSPMMINNDDNFVSHFYHWIGETFLGSWRVWSNLAWRTGEVLPNFKTVAFVQQFNKSEAPPGSNGGQWWEDTPGANKWYTEKIFPGVKIESQSTWQERADSLQVYHIPLAVLADRRGGHSGPSSAWKPWGDVLRLPVSSDWLTTIRDRILNNYSGPVPLKKGPLPKVLYLSRQDSTRRLVHEDHDKLVLALEKLHKDGVAEVSIEMFGSHMPFEDQVAKISTVDVLLSVHGNGLTHILWMDPGRKAAVFEFQPVYCTITDYSPLAIAAGVQHYMVHDNSFCLPEECGPRTCGKDHPEGINTDTIRVTAHVITDEIRRILSK
ncbi:hypothetical protein P7C73_g2208, partial [Tremellales sp. Uapishka_1]